MHLCGHSGTGITGLGPPIEPIFQVQVVFDEIAENETKVTFKQKFGTAEECGKLRKFVPEKNEENMDRLEGELKKMQ